MKILVTGGAGFIGRHTINLLVDKGYEVRPFDRKSYVFTNCDEIWGDIRVPEQLELAFNAFKPEAVIHLAAQPSLQKSWKRADYDAQVNILGTINLLGLCQRYKVKRFVFASTSAVYAPNVSGVYNEASPTGPLTPYGVSKLAAENYVKISRVPYTILRLGNVYGPGQKPLGENQLIPRMLAHIYQGKPFVINGDGKQERDFVYVEDVADAFLKAVEFNLSQTFNIGSGKSFPINSIVNGLLFHSSRFGDIEYGPAKVGELFNVQLESKSAEHYLGWKRTTSIMRGLQKTIDAWPK